MIKLICSIFMYPSKSDFFNRYFMVFFTYMNMLQISSAKYYQDNKERQQKSLYTEEKNVTIWQ